MDIERASKRREVKRKIGMALLALDLADRVTVLADLLADANDPATTRSIDRGQHPVPPLVLARKAKVPLWRRIEAYCIEYPSDDGVFMTLEVGQALGLGETPTMASTLATSAVQRRSNNTKRKVRRPKFEWIGDGAGKFRLLNGIAPAAAK